MGDFEKDHHEVKMVSETCDEVKDSKFRRNVSRRQQKASSITIPNDLHNNNLSGDDDKKYFRCVMHPQARLVQQWKKIFAFSCLVEIFIDPLFFFLFYVNKDDMCVDINWRIAISLVVYRSINDFVYFFYILLQFRMAYFAPKSKELVDDPKKISIKYLKSHFLLDLFVIFPFPQILMIVLPKYLRKAGANFGQFFGVVICVQYLFRLIRFLQISTTEFKHPRAKDITNFLIFLLFGHLVGSSWYLFGLQRVNECFQDACHNSNITGCLTFIGCSSSRKNPVWTNNVKAIACLNSSSDFSYGLYEDAVPLTMEKYFFYKYLFALFWGFQQVMSLGDNLKPTHNIILEVCFAMAIIALGLWFFVRLVENIQGFLQTLRKRREEKEHRVTGRDVEQWMNDHSTPEDMRKRIRMGVNAEMLLKNLPQDLQRDIRRHLCKIVQEPPEQKNDGEEVTQTENVIEICKGRSEEKEIEEEIQFAIVVEKKNID